MESDCFEESFEENAVFAGEIEPSVSWVTVLIPPADSNSLAHASSTDSSASESSSVLSDDAEPVEATRVTISSIFHPEFSHKGQTPDILLVSSDLVYFCVCGAVLHDVSCNGFGGLLPAVYGVGIPMPLSSQILNIFLHASYRLPLAQFAPSIADIASAVAVMHNYGISPALLVSPDSALFQIIVYNAPRSPLECYALAASAQLEDLAVVVSQYTLSTPLYSLTNDIVDRIGSGYLRRLFFLHCGRIEAFKRLALPPPGPYVSTEDCDLTTQREISRAWALAMAYLTWEPRPDLPASSIEAALNPLREKLQSNTCRQYLDERTRTLLISWALVKRTI